MDIKHVHYPLNIAIDFDGTYSADPEFFGALVKLAKEHGHKCYLVTQRDRAGKMWHGLNTEDVYNTIGNSFEEKDILFCGNIGKREFVATNKIKIDIWIDDNPQYIDFFWPLQLLKQHG